MSPIQTIRQIQRRTRLLANDGKAIPPHRERVWLWQSTICKPSAQPEELNTKPDGV